MIQQNNSQTLEQTGQQQIQNLLYFKQEDNSKEMYIRQAQTENINRDFGQQQIGKQKRQIIEDQPKYNSQITINQDSSNQMLTLILEPGDIMWYRGQIIASNRPYLDQENFNNLIDNIDIDRLLHYLKLRGNITMKLNNNGPDLAYFCIRRRNGGGKILYLDYETYKQNFLFDFTKLLTINIDPIEYQLTSVTHLPNLSKLKFKTSSQLFVTLPSILSKLNISLQSNPGNIIYQKSLGFGEKLYIGNSQVIAISEQTLVQKKDNQILLTGPGIVFLQAPQAFAGSPHQVNQHIMYTILLSIFFIIITIQYLFI